MECFSARNGYAAPQDAFQVEFASDNLRMGVYNALYGYLGGSNMGAFAGAICKDIWAECWHLALDEFPDYYPDFFAEMKDRVLGGEWYEQYDLVEYIAFNINDRLEREAEKRGESIGQFIHPNPNDTFEYAINYTLERELAGYRLIGRRIVPIVGKSEVACIAESLASPEEFAGVRLHIQRALDCLSRKPEPDFGNAVNDSTCAVESAARVILKSENLTLGKAVKELSKKKGLHSALSESWSKLYGFVSDIGGVRHASNNGEIELDLALSKYIVTSCAAFSNYLIEQYREKNN